MFRNKCQTQYLTITRAEATPRSQRDRWAKSGPDSTRIMHQLSKVAHKILRRWYHLTQLRIGPWAILIRLDRWATTSGSSGQEGAPERSYQEFLCIIKCRCLIRGAKTKSFSTFIKLTSQLWIASIMFQSTARRSTPTCSQPNPNGTPTPVTCPPK